MIVTVFYAQQIDARLLRFVLQGVLAALPEDVGVSKGHIDAMASFRSYHQTPITYNIRSTLIALPTERAERSSKKTGRAIIMKQR